MKAIRADLLDFSATPAWGETDSPAVRWRPDHWLLVGDDGRIAGAQAAESAPGIERIDQRGRLLMPGFVDMHVHSAQLGVVARWGSALLDWLARYTFPAEAAWQDPAVAAQGSADFCDALLAHGTTAAAVFPTVHRHATEALFAAAAARNMRIVAGKVLMDRHAPPALLDAADPAVAERDCIDLIARWHGRGRASYAVTVRFAPTSSEAQLAMAGALCRADPTLYMQTHLAEQRDELRRVAELFPQARSYLDVYASAGLLHPRALFAHGIWLDDEDRAALAAHGAHLVACPSSNLFLGSGLFDWRAAAAAGVDVTLGSDVGGGPHLALPRTLADAYRVQALRGERLTAWTALHAATRGAAAALGLANEIGSLDAGCLADLAIWDWADGPLGPLEAERQRRSQSLHEKVFAWVTLADERHLAATWVAGRPAYERRSPA